ANPGLRGRVFGYTQGSIEDRASHRLIQEEEARSHSSNLASALKLVGPATPPGCLPPFVAYSVERRIIHREDCANYRGRREVVFALVRRGLEKLAPELERDHPTSLEQVRENILGALVMEIERDLHWRDRKHEELDQATGHPAGIDAAV